VEQDNVEVVRRFHPTDEIDLVRVFEDDAALGEFRAAREPLVDEQFEATFDPELVKMFSDFDSMRRGFDGLLDGWREWLSAFESYRMKPSEFIALEPDRVLVPSQATGRSKAVGVDVTIETSSVWTVRDGKILRLEQYFDRAKAEAAAGLREQTS
jgi:ketosteroid isomerase-like protein